MVVLCKPKSLNKLKYTEELQKCSTKCTIIIKYTIIDPQNAKLDSWIITYWSTGIQQKASYETQNSNRGTCFLPMDSNCDLKTLKVHPRLQVNSASSFPWWIWNSISVLTLGETQSHDHYLWSNYYLLGGKETKMYS
jgi:hypothetical protein